MPQHTPAPDAHPSWCDPVLCRITPQGEWHHRRVTACTDDDGRPITVDISRLTAPDGTTHHAVTVPGTEFGDGDATHLRGTAAALTTAAAWLDDPGSTLLPPLDPTRAPTTPAVPVPADAFSAEAWATLSSTTADVTGETLGRFLDVAVPGGDGTMVVALHAAPGTNLLTAVLETPYEMTAPGLRALAAALPHVTDVMDEIDARWRR